jgi:hypothetical protein
MGKLTLPPLKYVTSPNFSDRSGHGIDLIVVHDCEGSYAGSINWFTKPESKVSAHLVLREDGGEVTQMVDFNKKAWHAVAFNSRSIGLEMAGFAAKGFDAREWQEAADIVAFLLHKFKIPCQWARGGQGPGFCSHFDLGQAGGGHRDPTTDGPTWAAFVEKVKASYALEAPADWASAVGTVPGMPADFVPTPTLRAD